MQFGTSPPQSVDSETAPCQVRYPRKRWTLPEPDPEAAAELARHLKLSPVAAQVLLNRGFSATTSEDLDAGRRFLKPELKQLIDPARLPGVARAADRLAEAVAGNEKIAIYGDYDVDGITATAILWHALVTLGCDPARIETYVPHRIDEGYGLNGDAIRQLAGNGASVIVSVDCGVTAVDEALVAKEVGVDLIITDHHEWRDGDDGQPVLPDAYSVVHPRLPTTPGTTYDNEHLVGAGVAFKLAWEVGKRLGNGQRVGPEMKQFLVDALALAALGTIADVAQLVGENRVIARFGLGGLTQTRLSGLTALIDSAGLESDKVDSYDVGFKLAPRLNACGRMGHAREAIHMLTDATPGEARDVATHLEQENRKRQNVEKSTTKQASELVRDYGWDTDDSPAIVVAGEGWHPGVVGIVASRLVDEFHRPAIVLALNEDGVAAGSGRSIEGFHLASALVECDDLLTSHGGHAAAAGLKLPADQVDAFRERFAKIAKKQLKTSDFRASLKADVEANLGDVAAPLFNELARLGPFGRGNPRPILVLRNLIVLVARAVGKTGDHLQLQLEDGHGGRVKAIAFGCGDLATTLRGGDRVDVAAALSRNEWNGRVSIELEIKDIAPTTPTTPISGKRR